MRLASSLPSGAIASGLASSLEVLDAHRGLLSAQLGLWQAQLLELSAVVELLLALGASCQ